MALKRKINKEAYDALPDAVKAEYKTEGMDFVLDVEGFEDPAPELRRARDREKQRAEDAEKKLAPLQAKVTELEDQLKLDPTKRGDIATLEASWKQKLADAEKAGTATADALRASVTKLLRDGAATALAGEISTAPNLLLPHLMSRLTVDFDGDEPQLRVLGADGKISAFTVDDLKKEFVANQDFAAIIVGSKASGGGANGGKQNGNGVPKKLADMSETERTEYSKSSPQEFAKAVEAEKSAATVKI